MISLLRRLRPGRRAGWIWVALTAGVLLNSLRLRTRVGALKTVPVRATVDGGAEMPDYVVVTAAGVVVTDELRREVAAYAGANRLDVVDMVPVGLPVEQLLEVVRLADPATYASSPLAPGRGPRQATLVHSSVLERAEIDAIDQLDPVAYLAVTAELKRFAAKSTDLAVVEGLDAVDEVPSERRGYLSALYSKGVVAVMGIQAAELGLLAAGMLVAPGWGGAAIAAFCAQPYLVAAGTTVRPSDLSPSSALARPLRSIVAFVRMLLGSSGGVASTPATTGRSQAEQEADYAELLSSGIDRFFEERRDTCPICGGGSLTLRIATKDLLQFKPGEFRLDECGGCGHIFQNPRLSIDGLDFYYKDFYDGMGGDLLEFVFSTGMDSYRGRVDMVAAQSNPKRWLDVGAGHAHFCLVASDVLPDTRFEGLDLNDGIRQAERRGWIEQAHVGLFPEVAADIAGHFDVVSMHHYLEHTREPAEEVRAASEVLEPGGYFLIEVPNPESKFGRWLGELWGPWFQPQHQHFLSKRNLARMLEENGFTVVGEETGEAHQPVDLAFGLLLFINKIAGRPAKPWLPPLPASGRIRRATTYSLLAPFFVPALIIDKVVAPLVARMPDGSNTYRMLARKN